MGIVKKRNKVKRDEERSVKDGREGKELSRYEQERVRQVMEAAH